MIDLDEILSEVSIYAPAAPEGLAIKFLREAAQDLCRRGKSWRATETHQVVTPECEVILAEPDAQIIEVEYAALNGRPLTPMTVADMDLADPGWMHRYTAEDGAGRYVVQLQHDTLTIMPREPGEITCRLVLAPSREALTVPDFLVEKYKTQLGRAAAGRLLTIPNSEIANPQLGAALVAEWASTLDSLAFREQRTQLRTKPRNRPSYF